MLAGQRLVADDGHEVALFPLDCLYITQGEYGSISHDVAMDFVGYRLGQIYKYPYYAPFTCRCVAAGGSGENYRVFTSIAPVHTPSGIKTVTFVVMHDNSPIASIGQEFRQGDLLGHTGTAGAGGTYVGDHMHLNVAEGNYAGFSPTTHGAPYYELTNSRHIYEYMYINDTLIERPLSYNWQYYEGPTPPPPTPTQEKRKHFKWVLYANKFRNRRF